MFTVCVVAIEKQVRSQRLFLSAYLILLMHPYLNRQNAFLVKLFIHVCFQKLTFADEMVSGDGSSLYLLGEDVCRQVFRTSHRLQRKVCFFYSQVSCFVAVTSDSPPFCPNTDKCSWFQSLDCVT